MSDIQVQAETVLALTRSLLAAADAEQWEDLERLESVWSQALRGLGDQRLNGPREVEFLASVYRSVQAIERQVTAKVTAERDRVAAELRKLRGTQSGNLVYLNALSDEFA